MCFELTQHWLWQIPYEKNLLYAADWCMGRDFFLLSDSLSNLLLIRIRYESVRATLVAQTLLNACGCTSTTEYTCSTVMVSSRHKLSVSQVCKSLGPGRCCLKPVESYRGTDLLKSLN